MTVETFIYMYTELLPVMDVAKITEYMYYTTAFDLATVVQTLKLLLIYAFHSLRYCKE